MSILSDVSLEFLFAKENGKDPLAVSKNIRDAETWEEREYEEKEDSF